MDKALREGGLYRVGGKAVDADGNEVEGGLEILDAHDKAAKEKLVADKKAQEDAAAVAAAGGLSALLARLAAAEAAVAATVAKPATKKAPAKKDEEPEKTGVTIE